MKFIKIFESYHKSLETCTFKNVVHSVDSYLEYTFETDNHPVYLLNDNPYGNENDTSLYDFASDILKHNYDYKLPNDKEEFMVDDMFLKIMNDETIWYHQLFPVFGKEDNKITNINMFNNKIFKT